MSDTARFGPEGLPRWVPSPLLQGTRETPRFLRAPWDAEHAHAFGPWRIGARTDPALPIDDPDAATAHAPVPELAESGGASTRDAAIAAAADDAVSAERLLELQAEAHARGVAEGIAQARAEMADERARESELLRHLTIELRALTDDPDRFYEPMRRLALHLAEQLVRAELKTSGAAISQVVRQSLAALDTPSSKVVVCLNPEDAAILQAMAPGFLEGLRLQPDPHLARGSVRLRMDDTVLEDLIEHRLEALMQPLMMPASRAGDSVLVRELTQRGEPVATPVAAPRRGRPGDDTIIDATFLPVDEPPAPGAPVPPAPAADPE
ncbi:MAG: hypothetical protein RIS88_1128 [Pseudomonadota bacterium]